MKPKIVVLGLLTNWPVAGMVHETMGNVVGLERLGFEVYYVEAYGEAPRSFVRDGDDGSDGAAAFLDNVMRQFGLAGRWAFHARHSDGRVLGMSERQLRRLYGEAELIFNLFGGTKPLPEHADGGRLVLIDTDPIPLQVKLVKGDPEARAFVDAHAAVFTWAENLGSPDCGVPVPEGVRFQKVRIPVLLDLWRQDDPPPAALFTTVANWEQTFNRVKVGGETYHWSKHLEFLKFLDLPRRTNRRFELALAGETAEDERLLRGHGWQVRDAYALSADHERYRRYIQESHAEFTVAKDANVRLRSGWFSDRSANYLASGRPVITQETGFSNFLPTGEGLIAFETMDDILAAVEEINGDYRRHSRAAVEIARDEFDSQEVLSKLVREAGVRVRRKPVRRAVGMRSKVIVLGKLTQFPVAGMVHLTMPYVVGLARLGYETYYVEAHGVTPHSFISHASEDGAERAAAFLDGVMGRFGLSGRWAYQARHSDGRVLGMNEGQLRRLYREADLIINLHGGTIPLPEHVETDRLVLVDTDPVPLQVRLAERDPIAADFLAQHAAIFTWGENIGNPDCGVPLPDGVHFSPTRIPVLLDLWQQDEPPCNAALTTIASWRQGSRVVVAGERYTWSKHHKFLKLLDLPRRTQQAFELALAGYTEEDRRVLEEHGWRVRPAAEVSDDLDRYRRYIQESRGEFTVAKDQYARLRSGWFSDRSATYLAAGRPVIMEDTGFGNILPTGEGLFAFSTMDEILAAVDEINGDYERHAKAAAQIARDQFDAEKVLAKLVREAGVDGAAARRRRAPKATALPLPRNLDLVPVSRNPTTLPKATVDAVLGRPVVALAPPTRDDQAARTSIVVPTRDNLVFLRLCLESLLTNTRAGRYEVIVVDNGSSDGSVEYLRALAEANPALRVLEHKTNRGFAAAINQGVAAARGRRLVLLNDDTVVPPGWLPCLLRHVRDPSIGLVGPTTNRSRDEAQIETSYRTYGHLVRLARERARAAPREPQAVESLTLFCAALRRDVWERVGALDEGYGLAMFEDDDYVMRIRQAGYRVAIAPNAFVHHFGQAAIGKLSGTGEGGRLFHKNRRRFEEKWGVRWQPPRRRRNPAYEQMVARVRRLVEETVPADGRVLVASKGDDALLQLEGRRAMHFPQLYGGEYAGYHPGDSAEAIAELERMRAAGADFLVIPQSALWWLEHYRTFREHLEGEYTTVVRDDETAALFELERGTRS